MSRRLLAELYRRSVALIYFSLYEGFGLPVLEAFQLGVPVLCSNTTSLPEVAADAALQCDSTDVEAMVAAMARIADSGELRTTLVARGRERLAGFDWGSSARRLLGALRTIASTPIDHDDVLRAIRFLDDRLTHVETERREVSTALVERDREIEVLRIALRERTTWAEKSLRSAEERLEVIHAQEAAIRVQEAAIQAKDAEIHAKDGALRELQRALDEWTARGAEMAEEYRRVAAAADERLRLIEQLHGQAVAGVGQTSHAQAGPAGAPPPPGDR